MHWVYVIQHVETGDLYFGKTNNLKRRIVEHNGTRRERRATKRRTGVWRYVYAEMYRSKADADERERKLKDHGSNKRWLKERIKNSLKEN